jgi:hypothetical protein
MRPKPSTIITIKASCAVALLSIALLLSAAAPPLLAHGGFDHVIGTVVTVQNDTLTVKTVKGNVDVKLDAKTEITSGDHKIAAADIKPGARVVVDIPEGAKVPLAHSVKVGVAAAASHGH